MYRVIYNFNSGEYAGNEIIIGNKTLNHALELFHAIKDGCHYCFLQKRERYKGWDNVLTYTVKVS